MNVADRNFDHLRNLLRHPPEGAIVECRDRERNRMVTSSRCDGAGGETSLKNLFEASAAAEIRNRIGRLRPDSPRQWGAMNVAQMMAHCSAWMEIAAGLNSPPRSLIGRIFGRLAKKSVLGEKPIRRNTPTMKSLVRSDERQFAEEQQRLIDWVDRFSTGGPEKCTTHPHSFFGPMTPIEWATMGYKHLDHHLKQFNV